MNKTVRIVGLDCPNCARSLQNSINGLKGVSNCQIDFTHSKLSFESNNIDSDLERIIKLTKKLEPEAVISEIGGGQKKSIKKIWLDILLIAIGVIVAVFCCFVAKSFWLKTVLFCVSAILLGYKTYIKAVRLLFQRIINENMLVTISVVGAGLIGEMMEALMVIALYSIGKVFEGIAIERSKKSIEEIINIQPEFAVKVVDGQEVLISPQEVNVGDTIIVKPGEKVALDGTVAWGEANVDVQSLTGETMPVFCSVGSSILSGSIVLDGAIKVVVEKEYGESTVSKIIKLIETAQEKKSKTETFIAKISKWYSLGVILFAAIVFGVVLAITNNPNTSFYRGFSMLVISCPCAFAISVPLTYFSGIGCASKNNVLIKGSGYLDVLAKVDTVIFDKTGTLTTGRFSIKEIKPINEKYSKERILELCAIGEKNSLHPIAKSIVEAYVSNGKQIADASEIKEVAGKGIYFTYKRKQYFLGKGAGDETATMVTLQESGIIIGAIKLEDEIKHTSNLAIKELSEFGVKTMMLTGDNEMSAKKVAEELGLNGYKSNLLPQDKYEYIKSTKNKNNVVAYVGDGINDAPSLVLSDVGISMGINGSSSSIEASDVVLATDNPQNILTAIKISKKTHRIVWQNILFSLLTKVTFLVLGALGITGMLYAVFADVGVTLLAILNSLRALRFNDK